jgi:hypothetical protein
MMPTNTQVSTSVVESQADLLARRLDNGYFNLYDGTQPASSDDAVTTQNLIASLRFSTPSAPSSSNGVLVFSIIEDIASMAGVVSWYRCLESDNTTVVMDGNIGLVDENMVLTTVNVLSGQLINITSFQHTVRKQ